MATKKVVLKKKATTSKPKEPKFKGEGVKTVVYGDEGKKQTTVLSLPMGTSGKYDFQFGANKAKIILENLDDIKTFIEFYGKKED